MTGAPDGGRRPDRVEIAELVHAYARLLDAGDLDGVAALFEHAVWRAESTGQEARGIAEVRAVYDGVRLYDGTPRTKHLVTNLDVEVEPSGAIATARSSYTVLQGVEPGEPIQVVLSGQYLDRFFHAQGRWRFAERRIVVDLVGDLSRHYR
jgi:3-phenylpropionate/cinnamic acid dioxygenase small subunit